MVVSVPKVTVIIPNYNHAPFLPRRIETVLSQTYENFEVIILDDCSTDNSKAIIENYRSHPKLAQIIYNEQNSGSTFKQWQKGISLAKGELIWIAESDDYSDIHFLEKTVSKHIEYPSAGVVYTNSIVINEFYEVLADDHNQPVPERLKCDYFNSGMDECKKYFIKQCVIGNASSAVFKKKVLEGLPFTSTRYKLAGDWMFYINVLSRSDIYYIAEKLNYFRTHGNNVRSRTNRNEQYLEEVAVLTFLMDNNLFEPVLAWERIQQLRKNARHALNYSFSSKSFEKIINSYKFYRKTLKALKVLEDKLPQQPASLEQGSLA